MIYFNIVCTSNPDPVNQRVLGSSPRGGAKSLTEMSGFFVFNNFGQGATIVQLLFFI